MMSGVPEGACHTATECSLC